MKGIDKYVSLIICCLLAYDWLVLDIFRRFCATTSIVISLQVVWHCWSGPTRTCTIMILMSFAVSHWIRPHLSRASQRRFFCFGPSCLIYTASRARGHSLLLHPCSLSPTKRPSLQTLLKWPWLASKAITFAFFNVGPLTAHPIPFARDLQRLTLLCFALYILRLLLYLVYLHQA